MDIQNYTCHFNFSSQVPPNPLLNPSLLCKEKEREVVIAPPDLN